MQTFHLQRAEHCLAARVIPAIAPSTHQADNPVAPKDMTKIKAGILAPAITMEQQSWGLLRMTLEPGHAQRINHQAVGREAFVIRFCCLWIDCRAHKGAADCEPCCYRRVRTERCGQSTEAAECHTQRTCRRRAARPPVARIGE